MFQSWEKCQDVVYEARDIRKLPERESCSLTREGKFYEWAKGLLDLHVNIRAAHILPLSSLSSVPNGFHGQARQVHVETPAPFTS